MDKNKKDENGDKINIDINKLKEIEKLQQMIFNPNYIEPSSSNKKSNENKLNDHGHFIHNFSEYNIRAFDIIPIYFVKHHPENNDVEATSVSNFIPIITEIVKKDKDTIEITRVHLYKDYFNKKPYSTERILIRRNPSNNEEDVFLSFYEDKLKKEVTSLSSGGDFAKVVKFKKYRNPNELLFFQNIFYYRCILETYFYYRFLNKIPAKKDFSMKDMAYNEFMKNLF